MIRIETHPTDSPLFGQSKWWGQPDMPADLDYPEVTVVDDDGEEYQDPLTFVCQLRCRDLAPCDPEGQLPHEGMLYFFAALDYFFGHLDTLLDPGMGLWQQRHFRVLYAPTCDELHTHSIVYDDGTPACRPAEAITFGPCDEATDGLRLLGRPWLDEVHEQMPDMVSLLQLDGNDRWGLRFYDCGMLHFLISPSDLANRRWDRVQCHLFSF